MAKISGADKPGKKAAIAKKAAALFRKKGYPRASMRELGEALKIEAPSLYNHFRSKGEMLDWICTRVAAGYLSNLEQVLQLGGTYRSKLESLIRYHIRCMVTDFDEHYVASHEWKHLPDLAFQRHQRQRKDYEAQLVTLIDEGVRKKEFRPVSSYVVMLTLLSAVRGIEAWHRSRKPVDAQQLEDDMCMLLLNGIIR